MKDSKELYADIFDQQVDPQLLQQTAELEKIYQSTKVPKELTWTRLRLQAYQQQTSSPRLRYRAFFSPPWAQSRPRLVALLAALLLVVLVTGGAFALSQEGALDFLFQSNKVTQQLLSDQQFTSLNQQWLSSNGYKIHLAKGYADANNIILGIVVDAPHGLKQPSNSYDSIISKISLRTLQGTLLPEPSNYSSLDTTKPADLRAGYVLDFDASAIEGNPTQVDLLLQMELGCSFFDPAPQCTHKTVQTTLHLPFHAGKVITPHQTITANGQRATLDKIVITPSEARFFLSGWTIEPHPVVGTSARYDDISYQVELSTGGQTSFSCTLPIRCTAGANYLNNLVHSSTILGTGGGFGGHFQDGIIISAQRALDKQHGKGTLTITREVTHMIRGNDGGYQSEGPPTGDDKAQPWVFTFTLP